MAQNASATEDRSNSLIGDTLVYGISSVLQKASTVGWPSMK